MAGLRTVIVVFSAALFATAGSTFGQTERLNPNPLQPSGVGSGSDVDRTRGGGGTQFGRGVGPGGNLSDENPADTLLRGLGGSNAGRRSGQSMFGDPRRQSTGYRGVKPKFKDGALVFDKRGTYEEAIYGSRPGSYSMARTSSRRAPSPRRAAQP